VEMTLEVVVRALPYSRDRARAPRAAAAPSTKRKVGVT
jgi:hypothetical protein